MRFLAPQSVKKLRSLVSAADIACLWMFKLLIGPGLLNEGLKGSVLSCAKLWMGFLFAKIRYLICIWNKAIGTSAEHVQEGVHIIAVC